MGTCAPRWLVENMRAQIGAGTTDSACGALRPADVERRSSGPATCTGDTVVAPNIARRRSVASGTRHSRAPVAGVVRGGIGLSMVVRS